MAGIVEKKDTVMTYKMERFKVTLSDDSNGMKQYGGTSQVETSLIRGGLDAEFNDSLGKQ